MNKSLTLDLSDCSRHVDAEGNVIRLVAPS